MLKNRGKIKNPLFYSFFSALPVKSGVQAEVLSGQDRIVVARAGGLIRGTVNEARDVLQVGGHFLKGVESVVHLFPDE